MAALPVTGTARSNDIGIVGLATELPRDDVIQSEFPLGELLHAVLAPETITQEDIPVIPPNATINMDMNLRHHDTGDSHRNARRMNIPAIILPHDRDRIDIDGTNGIAPINSREREHVDRLTISIKNKGSLGHRISHC
jgi:hypothetical protein